MQTGPYPADQVVKDLDGSFAFVVYDSKGGNVFAALGSDGGVQLYWGIAADGSVVISDELEVIKEGCAKSFAPSQKDACFIVRED
ncbi:Aluminium induced protein with YGL and LRDR motifs [Prunus dulcis]|uniref:Aluminium induced protein with YGL and LRDR motifs n=1 Tax=Prunus dulcis TaxID=3755 RepID=A0A4Y1RCF1_PRUDU|nr:Aluminium induced protein with YGL and LRDR motifs [Prunus dulcis]